MGTHVFGNSHMSDGDTPIAVDDTWPTSACFAFCQVVIKDFSSFAVETFLKFLYKGTVDASPERLCEVIVIADKYQVLQFKNLCLKMVEDWSGDLLCVEIRISGPACPRYICMLQNRT